jgi:hypothetical protein
LCAQASEGGFIKLWGFGAYGFFRILDRVEMELFLFGDMWATSLWRWGERGWVGGHSGMKPIFEESVYFGLGQVVLVVL